MKIVKIIVALYAAACLFSLFLIPASAHGWLGVKRDPLGGVFALLLAMLWTMWSANIPDLGPLPVALLLALCMLLNIGIVLFLASRFTRRR